MFEGHFLFSVITKTYPNFLRLPFEKQNHRNIFLCKKENPVPTFVGSKLHVSTWQRSAGKKSPCRVEQHPSDLHVFQYKRSMAVIATIRIELAIGFNPCFFFEREPSQMANSIFFSLPIHLG